MAEQSIESMMAMLVQAAKLRRLVRFKYIKPSDPMPSIRTAECYHLTSLEGQIYLHAWQVKPAVVVDAPTRTFRLDRMSELEMLEQNYQPRDVVTMADGQVLSYERARECRDDLEMGFEEPEHEEFGLRVDLPPAAQLYLDALHQELVYQDSPSFDRLLELQKPLHFQQVRVAHACFHARRLIDLVEAGHADQSLHEHLQNIRHNLTELGWAPPDRPPAG